MSSIDINTVISDSWPNLHSVGEADNVFFDSSRLTAFINDSLRRLTQTYGVNIVRDTASLTFVDGTAQYGTPPDCLSVLHVYVDSIPLTPRSSSELELLDPQFQTAKGNRPKWWYMDRTGIQQIGFYPVPNSTAAGKHPEVICHRMLGCTSPFTAPLFIQDYLEFCVMKEAYQVESDIRSVDIAQAAGSMVSLYGSIMESLWRKAQ